jgi:hypothetical protein
MTGGIAQSRDLAQICPISSPPAESFFFPATEKHNAANEFLPDDFTERPETVWYLSSTRELEQHVRTETIAPRADSRISPVVGAVWHTFTL